MNKSELIASIAAKEGYTKTAVANVIDAFLEETKLSVQKGDPVQLIGFGTFKQIAKPAKTGRNPRTGETIKIAAKKVVKFVPGKAFKEQINKKGRK